MMRSSEGKEKGVASIRGESTGARRPKAKAAGRFVRIYLAAAKLGFMAL